MSLQVCLLQSIYAVSLDQFRGFPPFFHPPLRVHPRSSDRDPTRYMSNASPIAVTISNYTNGSVISKLVSVSARAAPRGRARRSARAAARGRARRSARAAARGRARRSARVVARGRARRSARVVARGRARRSARAVARGRARRSARAVARGRARRSARAVPRGRARRPARAANREVLLCPSYVLMRGSMWRIRALSLTCWRVADSRSVGLRPQLHFATFD